MVVVSYNRIGTLTEVINGIRSQTRPVDKIIVVDNGSSDGSRELVSSLHGEIGLISSSTNGGGAGGFAKGIAWAMELDYDFVWLMDDDAVPHDDALALLLQPFDQGLARPVAFTCPRVNDAAGKVGPRNFPLISQSFDEVYPAVSKGLLPVKAATFVGPLISLDIARKTHLPLEDFFIWHDDMEYTARLAQYGTAYSVPSAQMIHFVTNPGPRSYNAGRNFYNVRNIIWWIIEARGNKSYDVRVLVRQLRGSIRSQFQAAPNKIAFLGILIKAVWAAVTKSPRRRGFIELVAESRLNDGFAFIHSEKENPAVG
ncbi:glycosyltransferase family 2 protein [Arthrobacter sp. FB24]|uniref:glycosyltransferase family 2 protein n=1 Tax=Arthrobacter sp. (strain FB24) TaxID=290399 RepID=UPI0022B3D545|nr:glycosyltransferase family 2 protein [Arthrobacter sp. FB24]